jgi:hypothetical protein
MKIRVVGADLFHVGGRMDERTDGQRDIVNLTVTFRNFTNAPKNNITKYVYVVIPLALFSKTEVLLFDQSFSQC